MSTASICKAYNPHLAGFVSISHKYISSVHSGRITTMNFIYVKNYPPGSLYYDISLIENGVSVRSIMCHENELSTKIPELLRKPSIFDKREK